MKRILVIEPYFGGSHKQFLLGLQQMVDAEYLFLTLPARKWKMRMQLSAPYFVEEISKRAKDERFFDRILFSTFIDVAVFKSLVQKLEGWNTQASFHTYFHENQFVYPNSKHAPENHQFTAINFTTALASDSLAFNSEYNKQTFLEGCQGYLRSASDMKMEHVYRELERKSSVIYPGIDFSIIDSIQHQNHDGEIPVVVWNHRWEHDKNPQEFFDALRHIKAKGIDFRLMVLGESFRFEPECFAIAKQDFAQEIVHFGYAENYEEYCMLLHQADIVVSTAVHEFYGIAVIEAVRAGCRPLLPKRLSYPELFDKKYLYGEGKLVRSLEKIIGRVRREGGRGKEMTETFAWQALRLQYKSWLKL